MNVLKRQTKRTVYFGIKYFVSASWSLDRAHLLKFQQHLLERGLDFSQTNIQGNSFVLSRTQPSPLQIRLEANGPQVSSINVFAQKPTYDLSLFIRDADVVFSAYRETWRAEQYQVIRKDAKIQHLYSCTEHAFKYIWERRLGQSPGDFSSLGGRPVAGGGLRLILPPHKKEGEETHSAEIRIESFLRDTRSLFVETGFVWPTPQTIKKDDSFDVDKQMNFVEHYATNEVWQFLSEQETENEQ
ncbi:hypothetical protein [Anaerohalosphaera lusitana]|nr:hypothetical protein [Anaerohalosphaera lusitana]